MALFTIEPRFPLGLQLPTSRFELFYILMLHLSMFAVFLLLFYKYITGRISLTKIISQW